MYMFFIECLKLSFQVKYKKNSPVIDADVEATVRGGNKKWTVRLLDNGNGGQYHHFFSFLQKIISSIILS